MAEPGADCVDVHAGAKEMDRRGVPDHVRADPLADNRRDTPRDQTRVALYERVDAKARDRLPATVQKDAVLAAAPGG